jgi:phenylacetate-CoA ligase
MSFPGRWLLALTMRARGSQALRVLEQIAPAPFADPQQEQARQWRRLQALLEHAEKHVPYYREMFRSAGLTSTDIRSPRDFAALPVLTKDIVRARLRDLVRDDVPRDRLYVHHSGGSTGVPLSFYRDRDYIDASEAGVYRNLLQCGWKPGEMIAFFWGGNEKLYAMPRWEFELRQRVRRMYQFDPFFSGEEDLERWLGEWKRLRFRAALGYASTLARFAHYAESTGRCLPPLRGVFTTAEKLYAPQRRILTRVFGCRVYDCYGSAEVQNIAAECPRGRMHVNADYVVLEVDRTSAAPGEPAPFLLTSLWNYAMPFIRYRNEDCGELEEGHCDCGNHFPLMKLKIAREGDNFVMPSGRVIHGEFFTHLLYGSQGIARFQFHQTVPDAITLWVVPGPGEAEARAAAIRRAVEQVEALDAAGRLRVTVRETEAIPLSAAGKHRFTRSDVPAGPSGGPAGTVETAP